MGSKQHYSYISVTNSPAAGSVTHQRLSLVLQRQRNPGSSYVSVQNVTLKTKYAYRLRILLERTRIFDMNVHNTGTLFEKVMQKVKEINNFLFFSVLTILKR